MFRMKYLAAAIGLSIASGCTPHDLANRYGVAPIPTAEEFETASTTQRAVIEALVNATYGNPKYTPATPAQWYEVALTGYTAVDQACDDYLRTIFKFDREKERFAASMVFADKATGAILSASSVAPGTVQIVSQAFGLGSNFGAAIADSYLYKIRPGAVAGVVSKLRTKYRTTIEQAMLDPKKPDSARPIRSAATAFQSIYGYREICYPETIESQIDEMLGSSKAENEDDANKKKGKADKPSDKPGTPKAVTTASPRVFLRSE